MRIIFMGSPSFSVPFLAALHQAGHEIVAVYSADLRVRSRRGEQLEHCAVAKYAIEHNLNLRTPRNFRDPAAVQEFIDFQADLCVVVAYGVLLPEPILQAPKHGCLNVHPSLLPRWRGAAPIERAIAAGDNYTGVMIMQMDSGLDTGPVALSAITNIDQRNAQELREHLAQLGTPLLMEALRRIEAGELLFLSQLGEPVYAHKIIKEETRMHWHHTAFELYNKIRAFAPLPGAWCYMQLTSHSGKQKTERVKILSASLEEIATPMKRICGDGDSLYILSCKRPGGREMPVEEFVKAYSNIEFL
ncbi:methionyl-tRNA formyltransferase [Bartonella sp. TP]|uniref:methionyl-tRNA formyltransferase n=1 Tax=Bartonella sp. TP TaxID=3057550 RepID=UPI0025B09E12|nr:methionyl-tRNA formyltransferase [Bartonella sp. TP]MDN5249348.1 methionyl-tRNA formyltransferase [Alphaproteobacteria bacterium]WJW80490.1 methionyl-tRNA formyltransferase [Bartonella sp. TP]